MMLPPFGGSTQACKPTMESSQPPHKRTRTHSVSSDTQKPTKTIKTGDVAHAPKSAEPADIDSELSDASDVEAEGEESRSPEHSLPAENLNAAQSTLPPDTSATGEIVNAPTDAIETNHEPNPNPDDSKAVVYSNGDWEAVFDPQTNAYYFVNSKTGETTWTNPLVPTDPAPIVAPQRSPPDLGGIDPELAHLDPQMARIMNAHSSNTEPTFAARFNAKTGRFEGDPTRDPSRVSEFARARTQTEAFFDVAGWEKTLEKHNGRIPGTSKETRATAIDQGKKLSKTQLNLFKQQKMEKKARNQRAWLS
ncbi:hypothetical protein Pst134EA_017352 [Puccinia striiformis f. sp. tritici]|uniref:hypothetical protein n=1 Tax=Puccinia striiformis f. sp. tritici TaxID=168172 RepID=UPI0020080B07|nr:hypothetical protein Pst134EA_017352 [Puccinia striiformis f. sp. tritici]KAH9461043.1 hypothetical protein Pst134EA_017352 [Puccinia striiformis f. sp. tritici]